MINHLEGTEYTNIAILELYITEHIVRKAIQNVIVSRVEEFCSLNGIKLK